MNNMSIITLMVCLLASVSNSQSSSRSNTSSGAQSETATTMSQPGIIGNDILSKIGWYETTYTVTTTLCNFTGQSTNSSYCGPVSSAQSTNRISSTEIIATTVETVQSGPGSSSLDSASPTMPPGVSNGTNTMMSPEKPDPPYANQTWIRSSMEGPSPTPQTSHSTGTTTAASRSGSSGGSGSTGSSGGSSSNGGSRSPGSSGSSGSSGGNGGFGSSGSTAEATSGQNTLQPSSTILAPPQTDSLAHRVNADGKDAMAFWVAISAVMLLELGVNLPYWI